MQSVAETSPPVKKPPALSERVKLATPRPVQTHPCAWCGEGNCGKTFEEHRQGFVSVLKVGVDRYYAAHPDERPDYWK